jgi:NhaA family Na+:H+ antiporter
MQEQFYKRRVKSEAANVYLLFIASLFGLIWVNSVGDESYRHFASIELGGVSFRFLVNEVLMTFFFLSVGLEIKKELADGELKTLRKVALPLLCAVGGMIVPACVYLFFSKNDSTAVRGWAIPCATDIAFSLAVLQLASSKAQSTLRTFLSTLAIFDDLGGILIIALFYNVSIAPQYVMLSLLIISLSYALGRRSVSSLVIYVLLGIALWLSLFRAGVHPTISGALIAFSMPLPNEQRPKYKLLFTRLEKQLRILSNFVVLPLFALLNVGISFKQFFSQSALDPAAVGSAAGLVIGKPLGVFVTAILAVRLHLAGLPRDTGWLDMLGISCFAGIGFTVSLFVANLAFGDTSGNHLDSAKIGILLGSVIAAVLGSMVLRVAKRL